MTLFQALGLGMSKIRRDTKSNYTRFVFCMIKAGYTPAFFIYTP